MCLVGDFLCRNCIWSYFSFFGAQKKIPEKRSAIKCHHLTSQKGPSGASSYGRFERIMVTVHILKPERRAIGKFPQHFSGLLNIGSFFGWPYKNIVHVPSDPRHQSFSSVSPCEFRPPPSIVSVHVLFLSFLWVGLNLSHSHHHSYQFFSRRRNEPFPELPRNCDRAVCVVKERLARGGTLKTTIESHPSCLNARASKNNASTVGLRSMGKSFYP